MSATRKHLLRRLSRLTGVSAHRLALRFRKLQTVDVGRIVLTAVQS